MVALYAVAGFCVAAVVGLAVYQAAAVRPALMRARELLALHDELITGGSGNASERLGSLEESRVAHDESLRNIAQRVAVLEAKAATDLSHAGFVRYDAFAGSGSGLSYALALLNRQGDGLVLTSIYSRDDTRTFGKPVAAFKPTVQASSEELEAIERARSLDS